MAIDQLHQHLRDHYQDQVSEILLARNELTLIVQPAEWMMVAKRLKEEEATAFNMLIDICGIDYLHYGLDEWQTESATFTGFGRGSKWFSDADHHPQGDITTLEEMLLPVSYNENETFTPTVEMPKRFAVVYHLLSLTHNHRVRVKVPLAAAEQPIVDSVISLWPAANWFEREAFDLFGIIFHGHPDLRRLLTDYGFIGHPFRKDFPLIGRVEVRYDATLKRVIYHPVTIEPRVLGPKVIRHDARYLMSNKEDAHGK